MDEEDAFISAIDTEPSDIALHRVYADWLEEHNDRRADLLRVWAELCALEYSETNYRLIQTLLESYQQAVKAVDHRWVERLNKSRPWISEIMAVVFLRVYLRTRHGRKDDRQWVGTGWNLPNATRWHVSYWKDNPEQLTKPSRWRKQKSLYVDLITGLITEKGAE